MKQAGILIVSVILLISAGMWEISYFDDTSQYILSDVNYSKNAVNNNNFDLANAHTKELEETWGNIREIWAIFIEHNEMDKIDDAIIKYKVYIQNGDKEESLLYAEILEKLFRHVSQKQEITLDNVF